MGGPLQGKSSCFKFLDLLLLSMPSPGNVRNIKERTDHLFYVNFRTCLLRLYLHTAVTSSESSIRIFWFELVI